MILRLKNKLASDGINVDVIFNEIKILESQESQRIEVEDTIPLCDLTIIPFENVLVQNLNDERLNLITVTSANPTHFENQIVDENQEAEQK